MQDPSAPTPPLTPGGLVMSWLGNGVPLTLLMDLCRPGGPDSWWILRTELPAGESVTGRLS